MKTLIMVRHAKSSWKHDVIDHQRPLNTRGEEDAVLVSTQVKLNVEPPQKIISSDAKRALSTARYFKKSFSINDEDFSTNHELYDFAGQNVMNFIKGLSNSLDRVMIVGHNHAFTSIANMLGNKYIENVATCGFIVIEFDVDDWNKIRKGRTVKAIFPRELK